MRVAVSWKGLLIVGAAAACSSPAASLGSGAKDASPGADATHDSAVLQDASAPPDGCTVLASSFDRTCLLDLDCAPVAEGDWCDTAACLACPSARNTAINASALAAFNTATMAAAPGVTGCSCALAAAGVGWSDGAAYCDHGTCVAGNRPVDAGAPTATTLPACAYAPSLLASPADGGVAGWNVSRTFVECGGCAIGAATGCSPGQAAALPTCDGGSCEPCIVECRDDEYLVALSMPGSNPPGTVLALPTLPASCHDLLGTVPPNTEVTYQCCPCQ